jgi:RNA polymerase sigma-70 factor (ECF subfamily)
VGQNEIDEIVTQSQHYPSEHGARLDPIQNLWGATEPPVATDVRIADSEPARSIEAWDDHAILDALRHGDEPAFEALLDRYHQALVRRALVWVSDRAVAEDVVQETWLGLLRGLERFEERSSLKTWLFRILDNRARSRAVREGKSVPFSALAHDALVTDEPAVDPERFLPVDHPRVPGHWASPPRDWQTTPEAWLLSRETCACLESAIDCLQPSQRAVVTLRDVEGRTSNEVCTLLGLSESNQRVLLHRGRSHVRRAMERYFTEE